VVGTQQLFSNFPRAGESSPFAESQRRLVRETVSESESIGQYLRSLREQKKLSLEEAEEATKIRVQNIRAIESDEITKRVPFPYAMGFIRTYAAFLGADGTEVARRSKELHANHSSEMPIPALSALVRSGSVRLGMGWLRPMLIGAGVVLAAVAFYCLRSATSYQHRVTVRAVGRVPVKVYRDGRFVWGSTIEPDMERSWRAKRSIELKITRPENAVVSYKGRKVALPQGGTVSVVFDRRGVRSQTISGASQPARTGR